MCPITPLYSLSETSKTAINMLISGRFMMISLYMEEYRVHNYVNPKSYNKTLYNTNPKKQLNIRYIFMIKITNLGSYA